MLSLAALPGGPVDDLGDFLAGSREWLRTGSPYPPPEVALDIGDYAYPPLLAWLLVPIAVLPMPWPHVAWWGVHWVAFAFLCRAFGELVSGSRRAAHDLLWGLVLLVNLSRLAGVQLGQLQDVLDATVAWAVVLALRGKDLGAGVLLGLATALKIFPGALVIPMVLERRWRALGAFAATLGAVFLLGPGQHVRYVVEYLVGNRVPLPLSSPHVMSAPAVSTRLFHLVSHNTSPVVDSRPLELAGIVLLDGLVLLAACLCRGERARWAAGLLAVALLSPGVGLYHVAIPILGLALAASEPDGRAWLRMPRPAFAFAILGLYVPCEYGLGTPEGTPVTDFLRTGWGTLLLSPHVYVLLAGLAGLAWSSRGSIPAPTPETP